MTEVVATYVRPPTIEEWNDAPLSVFAGEFCIADGPAIIYREATHAPNFYFPPQQVSMEYLRPRPDMRSYCEYKGIASYYDVLFSGEDFVVAGGAWAYHFPNKSYKALADHFAFYPHTLGCYVGDEQVTPEDPASGFYGGWIWSGLER